MNSDIDTDYLSISSMEKYEYSDERLQWSQWYGQQQDKGRVDLELAVKQIHDSRTGS